MADTAAPEPPSADDYNTTLRPWLRREMADRGIAFHGLLQGHCRYECRLEKARILAEGEAYLAQTMQFPVHQPAYDAVMVRVRNETPTHVTMSLTFE
jgi:hypothetical protein